MRTNTLTLLLEKLKDTEIHESKDTLYHRMKNQLLEQNVLHATLVAATFYKQKHLTKRYKLYNAKPSKTDFLPCYHPHTGVMATLKYDPALAMLCIFESM